MHYVNLWCVCACVRACVRACVCGCVCVCVCDYVSKKAYVNVGYLSLACARSKHTMPIYLTTVFVRIHFQAV